MRVRRDILPADASASTQMPFTTAQAIIVPPFLTNGVWLVEVKGTGSTAFTLTSNPLELQRPAWIMPAPGETNQTPGVVAPLLGETGIDTNGVPFQAQSTFLEQGFLHYYAITIPGTNSSILAPCSKRSAAIPTCICARRSAHPLPQRCPGASGNIYDRSHARPFLRPNMRTGCRSTANSKPNSSPGTVGPWRSAPPAV